jgi:predicted deacetylase
LTSTVASSPPSGASSTVARDRRRHLLVSIHDVTPALERNVRTLWEMCRGLGVVPALLVVPDWHGEWPLGQFPAFTDWLQECTHAGAEIFLHGQRHDEVGLPRSPRDAWRAWGKTAREGEFLTLDEHAARARIDLGLSLFAGLGLHAIGFVPPAWLARPACDGAVAGAGLRFSEDDSAIHAYDATPMRRITSPVVRWSSRTALRAYGSTAVAALRWRTQRRASHVRIALHPSDLDHPATARSVSRALDRWLSVRPSTRYADL